MPAWPLGSSARALGRPSSRLSVRVRPMTAWGGRTNPLARDGWQRRRRRVEPKALRRLSVARPGRTIPAPFERSHPMTVLAVPAAVGGSLRQPLIDDMTLRRFSRATQRNYIRDVGRLAAFLR